MAIPIPQLQAASEQMMRDLDAAIARLEIMVASSPPFVSQLDFSGSDVVEEENVEDESDDTIQMPLTYDEKCPPTPTRYGLCYNIDSDAETIPEDDWDEDWDTDDQFVVYRVADN